MSRHKLAMKVAKDSESYKNASKEWTNVVLDALADSITYEKKVMIQNLGVFEHVVRAPRVGRNYKTGERVEIPAKMVIQFTPCDRIRELVELEDTGYHSNDDK